jgi:enoyl-CoA hydratase
MILTGRPVRADEALAFGLANRVVPKGQSREAAESLAREIAQFPQDCLRADRRSAYESIGLAVDLALRHEFVVGSGALASQEITEGLKRFRSGQGRHGSFES